MKKWEQKYKIEYVRKALIVSLNQTRATNMRFALCALLIFRLHMALDVTTPPYFSLIIYADLPYFTAVGLASLLFYW